jgi:hypothetical protein
MVVKLIGGGNQSTWRKPPTCRKSLINLSHNVVSDDYVVGLMLIQSKFSKIL